MKARCWFPKDGGYIPAEKLTPQQREQVSRQLVQRMGAAIQERVNMCPKEYERI